MKKKIAAVIIFIIVLVFPLVSWPITSCFEQTIIDENRQKAAFPTFGENILTQFDAYFTDRAPYRNSLIKLYNDMSQNLNKVYEKLLLSLKIPYFTIINKALVGKEDWLFYTGDNNIDYYRGINLPTEQELQTYVARAEKVNNYFKQQGKEFIIFIAPNKEQIYSEYLPFGLTAETKIKRLDVIYAYFKEHSNIKILYPKEELLNAKNLHQTYYKQDTHWNIFGGYVGAKSILEAANIPLGDVTISEVTRPGGDLANMSLIDPLLDVDYRVSYRPEITLNRISSNHEYLSSNHNGKNLLLLGDSFRENLINVLAKEFETSTLNHRDSFSAQNNYQEQFAAADTIIFQAVERYEPTIFSPNGVLQRFIDLYNL